MHTRNSLIWLIVIFSMSNVAPRAQGQVSAETKEKMRAWAEQQRLLEPEAKAQVKAAISSEWLELDGFWYSIQTMWGGSEVVQLKNLKWTVAGDLPTSADNLNGVVWRGRARFTCEASRTYSENGRQWTQWMEGFGKFDTDHVWEMGIADYVLVKQAGEWKGQHKGGNSRWTKPRPDQLPGSSRREQSTTEPDANRSEAPVVTREIKPQRISPPQVNRWNMVVGAWYGVFYWPDGTINKQEIIFSSDLTQVRTRASDRSAASNWGNYPVHRNGDSLTWQVPGPGRTTIFSLAPDQNAQRAKGACQIIQQGRVLHSAVGEFGRVDVPLP